MGDFFVLQGKVKKKKMPLEIIVAISFEPIFHNALSGVLKTAVIVLTSSIM